MENIQEPQVEQTEQQVEQTNQQESTLPSDIDAQQQALESLDFSLTDEVKEKYLTKDGKILGKYQNLEQLVEAHKYLQDKHAMFVDDTKKQEKEISSEVEQEQLRLKQQETIQELLPQFMENGMQLTDDIKEKILETGIDERDLELNALKLKEKINHVYELVGGKENWEATKEYLSDKLTEEEYKKINTDLMGANSDYTVLGMYSAYKQAQEGIEPNARLMGDTTETTNRGYSSRRELFKDREYLRTPAGRKDQIAQRRYREKLSHTDLSKLGIKI